MVKNHVEGETSPGARQRILESAIEIFAARGFDGARVDDIARRAGVNKALIYYYFKNKEELLGTIFSDTIEEVMRALAPAAGDLRFIREREAATALMEKLLDYLEQRQNVIRIMLMESLKRGSAQASVFSLIAALLDRMFQLAPDIESAQDHERAKIMEFFTGLMPIVSYTVFHESWIRSFGLEEAKLRADFIASFFDSHFGATEKLYNLN